MPSSYTGCSYFKIKVHVHPQCTNQCCAVLLLSIFITMKNNTDALISEHRGS